MAEYRPPSSRHSGGPPYEVRDNDPRIEQLAKEVAERLRPMCDSMPESDFQSLVRAVARRQLRWG
jgi:hypothetical protein